MLTRRDAIEFCLTFDGVYEDYPFDDFNWTLMRHNDNKKTFAAVFERQDRIWINVKCEPSLARILRSNFKSVIPAYHMNKEHWNSIILDGSIDKKEIMNMIADSYYLTKKKYKLRSVD